VRSVAEELRRQGKDTPARLAEQSAGQTDRVANYLKGASGERLLRDIENFARRQPWAVAAGGLMLGFTASRFLKASSSRRYQAAQTSYQQEPPQGGRHLAAEPTVPVADVPVLGTDELAAPTMTTPCRLRPSRPTPSGGRRRPNERELTMATRQDPPGPEPGDLRDRSLGELLKQLSQETTQLVHQELELAKAELQQKGKQAGAGAGLFGGAGALGLAALGALTACFILALNAIMPAWLAALIVAVVYGIVAFVLVKQGQAKLKRATPPVPEQTIETVKEDVEWDKTQMRSDKT
jgi:uncharacterized membrane protein YqjE